MSVCIFERGKRAIGGASLAWRGAFIKRITSPDFSHKQNERLTLNLDLLSLELTRYLGSPIRKELSFCHGQLLQTFFMQPVMHTRTVVDGSNPSVALMMKYPVRSHGFTYMRKQNQESRKIRQIYYKSLGVSISLIYYFPQPYHAARTVYIANILRDLVYAWRV